MKSSVRHGHRKPHQSGVTLLELMVIVALLAVVGTIGTASYRGYIERARVQKAIQEISFLATQIAQYQTRPNGNGQLPSSLADLGLEVSLLTDPWGNPYQYRNLGPLMGVGGARKDHNNVQLNADYDLYSFGKNSTTNQTFTSALSQDDIVRGADGAYIGTPADYARLPSPYR